jgi:hypothetical protein
MNRITRKDIEAQVSNLEDLTGKKYHIGKAYGNHYTLESGDGGTDIVYAEGKTNFYNAIYAAVRIIEHKNRA